jgi:hypothetical protein
MRGTAPDYVLVHHEFGVNHIHDRQGAYRNFRRHGTRCRVGKLVDGRRARCVLSGSWISQCDLGRHLQSIEDHRNGRSTGAEGAVNKKPTTPCCSIRLLGDEKRSRGSRMRFTGVTRRRSSGAFSADARSRIRAATNQGFEHRRQRPEANGIELAKPPVPMVAAARLPLRPRKVD